MKKGKENNKMKKLNKLLALALAVILTLSLCTGVFADNTTPVDGHTYDAYQIFSGTQTAAPDTSAELGNIVWGAGVDSAKFLEALQADAAFGTGDKNLFAACKTAADVAEVASKFSDNSDEAMAFARIAYDNKGTVAAQNVTAATVLNAGYYLIVDNTKNTDNEENFVNNLALLQLTKRGTLTIECKVDVPEVEKKILETTIVEAENEEEEDEEVVTPVDANNAAIGDTVTYQFTGTMPTDLADYDTYYYVFHDTLSKGLDFVADSIKVEVDGVDVTKYFYQNAADGANDTTAITVGIADILALNLLKIDGLNVTKDSKVVVTYDATVNSDAVIGVEGNPNEVYLEYSNNPNDDGDGATTPPSENPSLPAEEGKVPTGETPKDYVITYVTQIKVFKVDENGDPLKGAEFTLTGDALNIVLVYKDVFTENKDGEYWKLANGSYTKEAPVTATYRELTMEERHENFTEGAGYFDTACTEPATEAGWIDAEIPIYVKVNGNADKYEAPVEGVYKKYSKTATLETNGTLDSNTVDVKAFVDEATGEVEFTGLKAGDYTLSESTTPAGYNTLEDIAFSLKWTAPEEVLKGDEDCAWECTTGNFSYNADDNAFEITVVNQKGSTLPETGGIGTTIFYVIGGILLVGAAILLITKKRMSSEA